jgi:hypothetical protein
VAEGGRFEIGYFANSGIGGSNPPLSSIKTVRVNALKKKKITCSDMVVKINAANTKSFNCMYALDGKFDSGMFF